MARLVYSHRISCLFCGKSCTNYYCLESHMTTHTHEKPYDCKYTDCDATFSCLAGLNTHTNSFHLGVKYECNKCGLVTTHQSNLISHRKKCKGRKSEKKNGVKKVGGASGVRKVGGARVACAGGVKKVVGTSGVGGAKEGGGAKPSVVGGVKKVCQTRASDAGGVKKVGGLRASGGGDVKNRRLVVKKKQIKEKRGKIVKAKKEVPSEVELVSSSPPSQPILPEEEAPVKVVPKPIPVKKKRVASKPKSPPKLVLNAQQYYRKKEWDPMFFLHMNRYIPSPPPRKPFFDPPWEESEEIGGDQVQANSDENQPQRHVPPKQRRRTPKKKQTTALKKLDSDANNRRQSFKFNCSQCDMSFADGVRLRRHEKIHSGDRPFLCQFCVTPRPFLEKFNLIKHIIRLHGNREGVPPTEPGKIRCPFCGEIIAKGRVDHQLSSHISTHHHNQMLAKQEIQI